MTLLGRLRNKSFSANGTRVGPLPRVGLYVVPVRCPMPKVLPTVHTHEGLFPSVHPLVLFQLILLGKPLRTQGTRKRLVPRVRPQVVLQFLLRGDLLPTNVADDGPVLPGVVVVAVHVPLEAG